MPGWDKGWDKGREEVQEEGREEGREKGALEEKKKNAKAMKALGISTDVIAKVTGLSITDIETI